MRGKTSIFINGRHYDVASGLPVEGAETIVVRTTAKPVATEPAGERIEVTRSPAKPHQIKPHHSVTLRRDLVKKPAAKVATLTADRRERVHVTQSPSISKFAPHPQRADVVPAPAPRVSAVVPATQRRAAVQQPQKPAALSSRELKEHLIKARLAAAQPNTKQHRKPKKHMSAPVRVSSVMAACLAIMILGGYISYINMPNLSVRVAAAQSGVDAAYPGYIPSGYRFDGPVAYTDGQVSLKFASNGGTSRYEILQQKSSWDSQAVLSNYVAPTGKEYTINSSQGLTVYTYGSQAAWVNHGVLYTIDGDAPLRTEQVLKIANSL